MSKTDFKQKYCTQHVATLLVETLKDFARHPQTPEYLMGSRVVFDCLFSSQSKTPGPCALLCQLLWVEGKSVDTNYHLPGHHGSSNSSTFATKRTLPKFSDFLA